MLAPAHRTRAEDIEATIAVIQANPQAASMVIEGCWGAAFHWIAYGTQQKHGKHQESHARLAMFARTLGELDVADWWTLLDQVRQGGFYGSHADAAACQRALELRDNIRIWALS